MCQVAHASLAYLDKHSTLDPLDPVMVSVVSSIPTGGNFLLKVFKPHDIILGLNVIVILSRKTLLTSLHK